MSSTQNINIQIQDAAMAGDLNQMQALLRADHPHRRRIKPQWLAQAFLLAVEHCNSDGHRQIICMLAKLDGFNVNHQGDGGRAALHFAAYNSDLNIVNYLIEANANVDACDKKGNTPLIWAARNGSREVVERLVDAGANIHQKNKEAYSGSALLWAAYEAHYSVVEYFMTTDAIRPNDRERILSDRNAEDCSALFLAAEDSKREAVDGEEKDAVTENHTRISEILLRHHADPNIKGRDGYTPLMLAVLNGNVALVKILLTSGARISTADEEDQPHCRRNAVLHGAYAGNAEIVDLLLQALERDPDEKKRVLSAQSSDGWGAFYLAHYSQGDDGDAIKKTEDEDKSGQDSVDVMQVLIKHGGSLTNEVDSRAQTIICWAAEEGLVELLMQLHTVGGKLRQGRVEDGATPLHFAALRGHEKCVKSLLDCRANPLARDKNGKTPLDYAREFKECLAGGDVNCDQEYYFEKRTMQQKQEQVDRVIDLLSSPAVGSAPEEDEDRASSRQSSLQNETAVELLLKVSRMPPSTQPPLEEQEAFATPQQDLSAYPFMGRQSTPPLPSLVSSSQAFPTKQPTEISLQASRPYVPAGIPEGLEFKRVPGDGNCLFYSVVEHTHEDQAQLRSLVADDMQNHPELYIDFIAAKPGETREEQHNRHIVEIRHTNAWADHAEIVAIMRIKNRPIIIVFHGGDFQNMDDENNYTGDPIFVCYNAYRPAHQRFYEEGNHYNALKLREGYNAQQIIQQLSTRHSSLPPSPIPQIKSSSLIQQPSINTIPGDFTMDILQVLCDQGDYPGLTRLLKSTDYPAAFKKNLCVMHIYDQLVPEYFEDKDLLLGTGVIIELSQLMVEAQALIDNENVMSEETRECYGKRIYKGLGRTIRLQENQEGQRLNLGLHQLMQGKLIQQYCNGTLAQPLIDVINANQAEVISNKFREWWDGSVNAGSLEKIFKFSCYQFVRKNPGRLALSGDCLLSAYRQKSGDSEIDGDIKNEMLTSLRELLDAGQAKPLTDELNNRIKRSVIFSFDTDIKQEFENKLIEILDEYLSGNMPEENPGMNQLMDDVIKDKLREHINEDSQLYDCVVSLQLREWRQLPQDDAVVQAFYQNIPAMIGDQLRALNDENKQPREVVLTHSINILLGKWNKGELDSEASKAMSSCSIEEEKNLLEQLENIAYPVRRLERQLEKLERKLLTAIKPKVTFVDAEQEEQAPEAEREEEEEAEEAEEEKPVDQTVGVHFDSGLSSSSSSSSSSSASGSGLFSNKKVRGREELGEPEQQPALHRARTGAPAREEASSQAEEGEVAEQEAIPGVVTQSQNAT